MSGELEAAGALGTAGLAAGAIEGQEALREGEGPCANCGAPLTGRYCSNCGQAAHAHRSLLHMGSELIYGLFNFDTKLWRTVPMMVFRPGTLTRNYIFGKRARYISPLALFLFCIFLLFFVVQLAPAPLNVNNTPSSQADAQEQVNDARDSVNEIQQELTQLRQQMAREGADAGDRTEEAALQTSLTAAQAELHRREEALAAQRTDARNTVPGLHVGTSVDRNQTGPVASITTSTRAPTPPPAPRASTTSTAPAQGGAQTPAVPAIPEIQNPYPQGTLENALFSISQEDVKIDGNPALTQQIRRKLSNPPLLIYKLQEAASKFSFLLVPLSLPFIAFLFLFKKNITLYDHTVFSFYSLCFASVAFVVLLLTGSVPWLRWFPGMLIAFGLPIHTFFHLKGAYALGWWSALWRTFFLLFFAIFVLIVFLAIVAFVGFAE